MLIFCLNVFIHREYGHVSAGRQDISNIRAVADRQVFGVPAVTNISLLPRHLCPRPREHDVPIMLDYINDECYYLFDSTDPFEIVFILFYKDVLFVK